MRTFLISLITFFVACRNGEEYFGREMLLDSEPAQCPYMTKDGNGNSVISWIRMNADSSFSFCYATSNNGKNFNSPVVIPNSGSIQPHSENLPKIVFKKSGDIIALWGVANPNPANKYSGAVFYVQSFDRGESWTLPAPLVSDTNGIDQRYYDVALLPNGEVGVVWLDNRKTIEGEGSAVYYAVSNGRQGFGNAKRISE